MNYSFQNLKTNENIPNSFKIYTNLLLRLKSESHNPEQFIIRVEIN